MLDGLLPDADLVFCRIEPLLKLLDVLIVLGDLGAELLDTGLEHREPRADVLGGGRGFVKAPLQACSLSRAQDVDTPGLCGLHGVEDDGRGVGPHLLLDDGDAHPLAPHLELLDGGGPEGVCSGEHNLVTPGLEIVCDLPDRRGLPRAVHADDHDRVEAVLRDLQGRLALLENEVDVVPHDFPQDIGAAEIGSLRDHFHLVDQFRSKGRPHVGRDEHFLQLLEEVPVDLLLAEEHLVDIAHEALLGLAEPFLQPLEEGALLFTVSEHDSLPFVETTCIDLWMYRITQDSLSSPKKRKSPSFQRGMNRCSIAMQQAIGCHAEIGGNPDHPWMPDQVRHDIFPLYPCTLDPLPFFRRQSGSG